MLITLVYNFQLLPGFLLFSYGLADGINWGMRHGHGLITIVCAVVGLLILGVTVLGYCGAIKDNRVMLYIYSGVMALAALIYLVSLFLIEHVDTTVTATPIINVGGALMALALAVTLAGLTRTGIDQGCVLSPPPNAYTPNI
ncbi:uncharacterized protein LOC134653736 [Cydia amplana]|uniref:uncharacterized protein LOC134653736 n=1 Tax=Cydia amplana TaxID=1869771 RepID=UPI002FE6C27F